MSMNMFTKHDYTSHSCYGNTLVSPMLGNSLQQYGILTTAVGKINKLSLQILQGFNDKIEEDHLQ